MMASLILLKPSKVICRLQCFIKCETVAQFALGHRVSLQGTKINSRGKEMPHGVRLYSIAASRYGDKFDGKTTSLCVRRAEYWDEAMGKNDPAKKGLCSNFLCDSKPGDEITMTGTRLCGCLQILHSTRGRKHAILAWLSSLLLPMRSERHTLPVMSHLLTASCSPSHSEPHMQAPLERCCCYQRTPTQSSSWLPQAQVNTILHCPCGSSTKHCIATLDMQAN